MTQDAVAGFLLQRFVIGAVIGVGYIHHTVTDQTVHMIVRIGPEVKAVAAGHDYPIDLPVVAEQVQVSIDGPAADMGILLPDALVDLLRSGVVPAAPDHVQNQLPLTGVASFLDGSKENADMLFSFTYHTHHIFLNNRETTDFS